MEEADVESKGGAQQGRELASWLSAVVPEGFSKEATFEKSPSGGARANHVTRRGWRGEGCTGWGAGCPRPAPHSSAGSGSTPGLPLPPALSTAPPSRRGPVLRGPPPACPQVDATACLTPGPGVLLRVWGAAPRGAPGLQAASTPDPSSRTLEPGTGLGSATGQDEGASAPRRSWTTPGPRSQTLLRTQAFDPGSRRTLRREQSAGE